MGTLETQREALVYTLAKAAALTGLTRQTVIILPDKDRASSSLGAPNSCTNRCIKLSASNGARVSGRALPAIGRFLIFFF